jgi:hypothetical protein
MTSVPVTRLSNDALIRELKASVAEHCVRAARQVALIAEIERRRLYAPAGYPSMFAYCVGELHLSEDAAYKRIRVARAARSFPRVLSALATGRVHLSGLTMLASHFDPEQADAATVDELLSAASHKSKKAIEQLLAERKPKPDMPARVDALMPSGTEPTVPGRAIVAPEPSANGLHVVAKPETQLAPGPVGDPVTLCQANIGASPAPAAERARIAPLAPRRYAVQFTVDQAGHDLLRHVQNLPPP